MRNHSLLISLIAIMLLAGPALAQQGASNDDFVDSMVTQMLKTNFLTPDCQIPSIQPKVVNLRRGWYPNEEDLIKRFFGSREAIMTEQKLDIHQIWGRGRRLKSGTVLYLVDRDSGLQDMTSGKEVEIVPTYLDIYPCGYEYANNIPHTPVYATRVKKLADDQADVSYYNVFEADEGQRTAEKLLRDMHGELSLSDSFRICKVSIIQDFGERLYVYQANPEYLTEYNVYGEMDLTKPLSERTSLGATPVALPVWDVYTRVMLDADNLLTAMAYFWDSDLKVDGTPKEAIHAGTALINAQEYLFTAFDEQPPLLTIGSITIGFIQDRQRDNYLIPVWFFDAWYTETQTLAEAQLDNVPAMTSPYAKNVLNVPFPFAVNALTGDVIILDKTQL